MDPGLEDDADPLDPELDADRTELSLVPLDPEEAKRYWHSRTPEAEDILAVLESR